MRCLQLVDDGHRAPLCSMVVRQVDALIILEAVAVVYAKLVKARWTSMEPLEGIADKSGGRAMVAEAPKKQGGAPAMPPGGGMDY